MQGQEDECVQRRGSAWMVGALAMSVLAGCKQESVTQTPAGEQGANTGYAFERGYPTEGTAQKAYDDADLNAAIQAYKFFYPAVSIEADRKSTRLNSSHVEISY